MIKKKIMIGAVCGVVALAVAGSAFMKAKSDPHSPMVTTTTLAPMTLSNVVNLTGTVQSETDRKIYSTLGYSITEVNVKVGDVVKKGDVLAQLDSENLQYDIAQQLATIDLAKRQSEHQIEMSAKAYENAKKDYENDLNSQALSADAAVDNAQTQVDTAQTQVDNARENYRIARDQSVGNLHDAEDRLNRAEDALHEAKDKYNYALNTAPNQIAQIEREFEPVKTAFMAKSDEYNSKLATADKEVSQAQTESNSASARVAKLEKELKDLEDDSSSDPGAITAKKSEIEGAGTAYRDLKEVQRQAESHKTELTYEFSLLQETYTGQLTAKNQAVSGAQSAAGTASSSVAAAESGVTSAEAAYNQAVDATYSASMAQMQQSIDASKRSVENALDSTETARRQKEATHNAIQEQIDSAKDALTGAQLSAESTKAQEIAIQKLQSTLNDTQVLAPTNGTVTAVYAKVGQPGNGLMFVVEDTSALKITTKVKEYDLTKVKEGMPVMIKSDGTGEKTIQGVVSQIAPVAVKTQDGSVQNITSVEFETTIQVTDPDSGLLIGMNTRLEVLTEEKQGAYSLPYDSVAQNAMGADVVYTVEPAPAKEDGKPAEGFIVHERPITTGMETDLYIEVFGEGLTEGTSVVSNPLGLVEGQAVIPDFSIGLVPGASQEKPAGNQMAMMMMG